MFKEMRRKNREISKEEVIKILEQGEYGTVATVDENGYPYSLPLSYVYYKDCIYFHCAREGKKLSNIDKNNKVSFSVVGDTELMPSKFSTKYESVVVFGKAHKSQDEEKELALLKLIEKYSPNFLEEGKAYIEKAKDMTTVIKIDIEHLTGKSIK